MNHYRLKQIEINLRSPALDQRKEALDELAKCDSQLAIPILERLAQDNDFTIRCLAVMGLGNHQTETSFVILKNILETEQDSSVLAEAANSLFEFGDRSIMPLQQLFIRSDHWLVQQTIISILVDTQDPDILLDIAIKAIAKPDQTTKESGILALSRLLNTPLKQQAFDLLTQLTQDSNWRIRWRTAISLTASSDPQARKLLAKLQQDENYRVVAAALEKAKDIR